MPERLSRGRTRQGSRRLEGFPQCQSCSCPPVSVMDLIESANPPSDSSEQGLLADTGGCFLTFAFLGSHQTGCHLLPQVRWIGKFKNLAIKTSFLSPDVDPDASCIRERRSRSMQASRSSLFERSNDL